MSQILYINILVDWSLSGIMTSKRVIRESEFWFHEWRVSRSLSHTEHTIHSGHYVIIVDIRNMATTSYWIISLSRF